MAVMTRPQTVRFRIGEVVHPHPAQLLYALFRDVPIEGKVVTHTSDGTNPLLVVRVSGFGELVIISHGSETLPSTAMTATTESD